MISGLLGNAGRLLAAPEKQIEKPSDKGPKKIPASTDGEVAALEAQASKLTRFDMRVDVSKLPPSERQALVEILRAARFMDPLFLRQVATDNQRWLVELAADRTPLGQARLQLFLLHKGPWDRLDHAKAFVPGVPEKPLAGSFYPSDATRAEVDAWAKSLTGAASEAARGFFTTIRRDAAGKLVAVPYSAEYQAELSVVAAHLRKAAAATLQPPGGFCSCAL